MESDQLARFYFAFMIVFGISAVLQLSLFIYALAWCLRNPTPHTKRLAWIWFTYSIAHILTGVFGFLELWQVWGIFLTIQFCFLTIGYWLYAFRIFLSAYDAYEIIVRRIES